MSEELKPCPFCGKTPSYQKSEQYGGERSPSFVKCHTCNYHVARTGLGSDERVLKAWNTRPIEDALRAELETTRIERDYRPRMDDYERLQAELQQAREATCTWTHSDDYWDTGAWDAGCGLCWVMDDGGPKDNEMEYCPKCGKKLVEVDPLNPPAEEGE